MSNNNKNSQDFPFYYIHPTPLSILANTALSVNQQQHHPLKYNTLHNNTTFSHHQDFRNFGNSAGQQNHPQAMYNKNGVLTYTTNTSAFSNNDNGIEKQQQIMNPERRVATAFASKEEVNMIPDINVNRGNVSSSISNVCDTRCAALAHAKSEKANVMPDVIISECILGASTQNNDSDSVYSEDTIELFVNRSSSGDGMRKENAKSIPPQISFVSPTTPNQEADQFQQLQKEYESNTNLVQTNQMSIPAQSKFAPMSKMSQNQNNFHHTPHNKKFQNQQFQQQQKETEKNKEDVVRDLDKKVKQFLLDASTDVKKSKKRKRTDSSVNKTKTKSKKSKTGKSPSTLKKEPVKPRCGYNFFYAEKRKVLFKAISEENPHLSETANKYLNVKENGKRRVAHSKTHGLMHLHDMTKSISKMWNNASKEEKHKYNCIAQDDKIRYMREVAEHIDYLNSLGIRNEENLKKVKDLSNRLNRMKSQLGKKRQK